MSLPARQAVPSRRRRRWLIAAAILVMLLALGVVFHAPILTGVADVLIVNDAPQPADIIFLLNSDYDIRPARAAQLLQQGYAPQIVIARAENTPAVKMGLVPNDTDISVGVLKHLGVPAEKIVILPYPGGTTSTFDEATVLKQYIEEQGIQKVLLVTSAFHSRRSTWIFRRELADVPVDLRTIAVPYSSFDQTNWWKNESGLITVNNEYIKLVYYLVKYR